MTTLVSRVACMRLLGGVQVTRKPARGVIHLPPPTLLGATSSFAMPPPNARHHPPPRAIADDESRRVGGRVHAVVRLRPPLARLPPPRSLIVTGDLRYALRYQPAPRSGRTARPATVEPSGCAIRHGHTFIRQNFLERPSNLTPGITRRPASLKVDERQRVGGRVHAVVRFRPP